MKKVGNNLLQNWVTAAACKPEQIEAIVSIIKLVTSRPRQNLTILQHHL